VRRVLYHPGYVAGFAAALLQARSDLHDMHAEHVRELSDLRRQLDEARALLNDLRAAVRARHRAEDELVGLRAIEAAFAERRDFPVTLH
jgi:hypothetical protein